MNTERRKTLRAILARIETAREIVDGILSDLQDVSAEENDYLDNMPDAFRDGEKGEKAQAAIDAIDEAISALGDVDFDGVASSIETACE